MDHPLPVSAWEKYGLPGLVIFSLLGLIVYVLRSQRDERSEWRRELQKALGGLAKANQGLAEAVHELAGRLKD